ncbi:MAG: hypothetical protein ABJA86_12185 [Nocardioidaceae bacterium]
MRAAPSCSADPWRQGPELHRRLAYVPGDVSLWPNLSGGEVIDLLGRLRGGLDEHRRSELLERFELRAHGRTVLLSSHILGEVEAVCDRVSIIRDGRRVDSGSLAELRHLTRTAVSAELAIPAVGLDRLPGVHALETDGLSGQLSGRRRSPRRAAASPHGRGRENPQQPAADSGGAVPAALPQPGGRRVMTRFTGTTGLLRLAIRLDRLRLAVWVVVISGLTIVTASSFASLYTDLAERRAFANSVNSNPALVALIGHVYNTDTTGGLTAWRMCSTAGILIALMSILTVNRHTPAEEESGRVKLLGSVVTGRFAAPAAAVLLVAGTAAVIAILIAVGLVGVGLTAAGSVALGAAICGVGWVFAAIAVVCAQLSQSARTSLGMSGAALGVAYALRAMGDPADGGLGWIAWLSPLEWAAQTRAFASDRWSVFALAGVAALTLSGFALRRGRVGDTGDPIALVGESRRVRRRRPAGVDGGRWSLHGSGARRRRR